MKKFHIKSIILGIGMGMVLTSMISIIYLAGTNPKLSKEEIITLARKYGMVEGSELLTASIIENEAGQDSNKDNQGSIIAEDEKNSGKDSADSSGHTDDSGENKKLQPDNSVEADKPEIQAEKSDQPTGAAPDIIQEEQFVTIKISNGDNSTKVAKKLLENGLISDSEAFIREMQRQKITTRVRVGEFDIRVGADFDEIIKTITSKPSRRG